MLRDDIVKEIKAEIKNINKEKEIDIRLEMMIKSQDKYRNDFNETIGELYSEVSLKKMKLKLDQNEKKICYVYPKR